MKKDSVSTETIRSPISHSMTLKKQLRFYLDHHGMTAAQLARKAKVPKQSISGWLSGNNPRDINQIKRVSDIFETSLDNLMFGHGLPSEESKIASLNALMGDDWIGGIFELRLRRVKK